MKTAIALIVIFLSSKAAQAQGIRISEKETRRGQVTVTEYAIDRGHLRSEGGPGPMSMFDASKPTLYLIDSNRKDYIELTKAALVEALQDRIANGPPAQRRVLEQMVSDLRDQQTPVPAPILSYRKTGSDKVGEWNCTKYQWMPPPPRPDPNVRVTASRTEICVTTLESLGFAADDFAIIQMFERYQAAFETARPRSPIPHLGSYIEGIADGQPFSGIAVRRISAFGPGDEMITEIIQLRREALPPTTFVVPPGFQKAPILQFITR